MGRKIEVVIIDDSAQWLQRLQTAVDEVTGLTVAGSAGTAHEALDMVTTLRPPIVILDLSLAAGTGIDVLRGLAKEGADTQVVVVTGIPSTHLREACLRLGARYFFDKGFEFEQLQGALQTLMGEVCTEAGS